MPALPTWSTTCCPTFPSGNSRGRSKAWPCEARRGRVWEPSQGSHVKLSIAPASASCASSSAEASSPSCPRRATARSSSSPTRPWVKTTLCSRNYSPPPPPAHRPPVPPPSESPCASCSTPPPSLRQKAGCARLLTDSTFKPPRASPPTTSPAAKDRAATSCARPSRTIVSAFSTTAA